MHSPTRSYSEKRTYGEDLSLKDVAFQKNLSIFRRAQKIISWTLAPKYTAYIDPTGYLPMMRVTKNGVSYTTPFDVLQSKSGRELVQRFSRIPVSLNSLKTDKDPTQTKD